MLLMSENIPALIARVKDYPTITRLSHGEQIKMIETLRDALESLSAPPATDTDPEALEQATLYGYQAVWDDGKFDADPAKNAWMWGRVQIAVKAAVERAARPSQPVQVGVTDDMVERAAEAAYNGAFLRHAPEDVDRWTDLVADKNSSVESWRVVARAALVAALGGGDHG